MVERLRESGVPVISVGAKTEGMGCIEFDDYHAMSQMVRHVICEHGARKLAYIDGPKEYSDAAKRAQAYRDVLEEEGIPFDESPLRLSVTLAVVPYYFLVWYNENF